MEIRQAQILVDELSLPSHRLILEGIDVSRGPIFSISEVTKVFFGWSAQWLRNHDSRGWLVYKGEYVGGVRDDKGQRRFNLAHVEKMVHALAEHNAIGAAHLQAIGVMVYHMPKVDEYVQ